MPLPPVVNHLTGFTISQELISAVLTLADSTVAENIGAGDTAALAAIGVTINVDTVAVTATLKVDMSDNAYYGGTLVVTIKDTLVEEPTWFDTTVVTINLTQPSCTITLADLNLLEATPILTL